MATTPNYDINYDDKRFTDVESDKTEALSELEETYGGMIANSDKYYQDQIDASKEWAEKQTQLQNEQTEFAIQEIEQQKAQAGKDYTKEQSGAYVDWQKQSNQYGANAEQMAAQGLANTGYSESSKVSMFNTYQNRVATAKASYDLIIQNYNNSITEARLQNSSILAEIAYEAQKQQLELALAGFQYKNQLILEKANKKTELNNTYYARYQDVLEQINTENALAETVRQYNEELERKKKEDERAYALSRSELALKQAQLAEEKRQFNVLHSSSGGSIKKSSGGSGSGGGSSSKNSGGEAIKATTTVSDNESVSAYQYLNELIKNGASKDKVSNEIALALRDGAITAKEAQGLRNMFTPRGVQYN